MAVHIDTPDAQVRSEAPAETSPPKAERAAVVIGPLGPIVLQSTATPLVGLAMLIIGMAVGYLVRPLLPIPGDTPGSAQVAMPAATTTRPGATADGLGGAIDATEAAGQATQGAAIMAQVRGGTRHYRGDPSATVVLIEFSDFQ